MNIGAGTLEEATAQVTQASHARARVQLAGGTSISDLDWEGFGKRSATRASPSSVITSLQEDRSNQGAKRRKAKQSS